jgi:hypothetical protein
MAQVIGKNYKKVGSTVIPSQSDFYEFNTQNGKVYFNFFNIKIPPGENFVFLVASTKKASLIMKRN